MTGCIAPISIHQAPRDGPTYKGDPVAYHYRVRCGRCKYCRLRRKMAWTGRLMLELFDQGSVGRFLTLTYRDDPGELDYDDFQRFMKRYRKSYGACRYFVVGEYGKKGGRGHWHAIIFGHPVSRIGHLDLPEWTSGFSFDGEANVQTIGYVAGYVLKKEVEQFPSIVRCSLKPGIGFNTIGAFARSAAEFSLDRWPGAVRIGGRRYPLSDGALVHFKREFLKEGGLPPREDDPDEGSLLNDFIVQGDAFFEERRRRDLWRIYERNRGDHGQKNTSRGSL